MTKTNWKKYTTLLLALGILDGIYLTIVHYIPAALKCPTVGTVVNCDRVLTSAFSNVFGIPLAVLGLVWFIAGLIILFKYRKTVVVNIWSLVGLGGVLYSFTSQAILGTVCVYCLILDALIISSIIFFIYTMKQK